MGTSNTVKYIVAGTNRPGSRTLQVARIMQELFKKGGESTEIIDLCQVGLNELPGLEYTDKLPASMRAAIDKINQAEGLLFICPEYNGSMPGALKYFIDHWSYPKSFEFRPMAFVGLGGRFGGLRPVEHLQSTMAFRNAFLYPERVFLHDVWTLLKDGRIADVAVMGLLESQVRGFTAFIKALQTAKLDANHRA